MPNLQSSKGNSPVSSIFFPVTSKLEKSKAAALSAQLCPMGYGRGEETLLLITGLHGIQAERGEERGLGMITANSASFGTPNAPVQLNNQLGIKKRSP